MSQTRNIMANMKAFAELKRNPFDLTNGHYYSQKCGEIIPIKAVKTIPGDYMKVQISDKNLSFPLNTSAFLHARKEISSYHVPYNHLFSLFNQLQASRPDPKTSALAVSTSIEEPRMSLLTLYFNTLFQFYLYYVYEYYIKDCLDNYLASQENSHLLQSSYDLCLNYIKELFLNSYIDTADLDGFNFILPTIEVDFIGRTSSGFNLHIDFDLDFPDCHFSALFQQLFIQELPFIFGTGNESESSLLVSSVMFDLQSRPRCFSWCRKLDMLGYGNLYPLFMMHLQAVQDMSLSDRSQMHEATSPFSKACYNIFHNIVYMSSVLEGGRRILRYVNLYPILAYNKVFYDYFRNTYYDLDYNSRNYNVDFIASENLHGYILTGDLFDFRFLDIEYHQWKKDIVTGALPEAQFGAVAGLSMSIDLQFVTNINSSDNRPDGFPHHHAVFANDLNDAIAWSPVSFDVLSLKRAEMLQEYRTMLMRNGNRTIDIFKGLYGDSPASENDNSPRFVDAFGSTLFVDTIVSTADTAQQDSNKGALGDLGARSVINGGGEFTFKTSDFGVLLFLGYIVPDAVYPSFGLEHANTELDPESHFIPFFQNLGFQPLHNYTRNLYYQDPSGTKPNNVRGFAPSYPYLKTDVDLCHGNFCKLPVSSVVRIAGGFSPGSASSAEFTLQDYVGSFNHWVPSRNDVVLSSLTVLKHFYVSPSYWDNVFLQKVTADFESDHFIVDTHIFIKSVRKLSKLGLPNF